MAVHAGAGQCLLWRCNRTSSLASAVAESDDTRSDVDAGRESGYALLDHFYCKFLACCRSYYRTGGNAAYGCCGGFDCYGPRKSYCCGLHVAAYFFACWFSSALRYGSEYVDAWRSLCDELYYHVGAAIIGSLPAWTSRFALCSCQLCDRV